MKIFVYGTLRSDAPMHGLIEGDCRRLCSARVRARLLDLGAFPGLVKARSKGEWVHGELYAIECSNPQELLERLDRYEGEAFERFEDEVVDEFGARVRAQLYRYTGDTRSGRRVASGNWLERVARL